MYLWDCHLMKHDFIFNVVFTYEVKQNLKKKDKVVV